jgi:diguanylate cyclase (GGDEF)-like protein
MNRIQDENRYYTLQLHEKYMSNGGARRYLSNGEKAYLKDHGAIRLGYQDNYLAFCAMDGTSGQLTGALKDYLDYISQCFENAQLSFSAQAYPSVAAAMEAMKKGEVDCVFPANLTDFDGENLGVVITPPIMRTEMDAVVRASEQKDFIRKEDIRVCVDEGNTNYEIFLLDNYPGWKIQYYPDTPAGLEDIAKGKSDCLIISNYRCSNISRQCEDLHLTVLYTGVDMDYCFAIREGDTELYSILAKAASLIPASSIHAALTYYSTEDVKISFANLIKDNLFMIRMIIAVVLVIILILLIRSIRAERKAFREERMVNELNRKVFVDALTSVRNKGAFTNYIGEIEKRLASGEKLEFAVGIFDCDNLKQINDLYGHDKGDIYIRTGCQLICQVFQHSAVFRIGGDEFAIVIQHNDYDNREELKNKFYAEKEARIKAAVNRWEEPRISMGLTDYDPATDGSIDDTLQRADRKMYENKRSEKMREQAHLQVETP